MIEEDDFHLVRIKDIPLRFWEDEAELRNCLTFPNFVKQLGKLIGTPVEFVGIEQRTKSGWADIVLKKVKNNRPIVVETRLWKGDYDHLGRLISYMMDLDARDGIFVFERNNKIANTFCKIVNARYSRRIRLHTAQLQQAIRVGDDRWYTERTVGYTLQLCHGLLEPAALRQADFIDMPPTVTKPELMEHVRTTLKGQVKYPVAPEFLIPPSVAKIHNTGTISMMYWNHARREGTTLARAVAHVTATLATMLIILVEEDYLTEFRNDAATLNTLFGIYCRVVVWSFAPQDGQITRFTNAAEIAGTAKTMRIEAFYQRCLAHLKTLRSPKASIPQLGKTQLYLNLKPGFNLVAGSEQSHKYSSYPFYYIDLRIFHHDKGLADNWLMQVREHLDTITAALPGEVSLWKTDAFRDNEAVLRYNFVSKDKEVFPVAEAPMFAEAIAKFEAVLTPIVQPIEYYE